MINIRCMNCDLHKLRRKIAQGKGDIPTDLLFIGEAPGRDENIKGRCFVGNSGKMLDMIIEGALHLSERKEIRTYFFNCIQCFPCEHIGGPGRTPTSQEILFCKPNVIHIYNMVRPKYTILLGDIAKRYYKNILVPSISLMHPARVLRRGGKKDCPEYLSIIRTLSNVIDKI